jgi:hypothetical protein
MRTEATKIVVITNLTTGLCVHSQRTSMYDLVLDVLFFFCLEAKRNTGVMEL